MNGCVFCEPPHKTPWFETGLEWCLCFVPKGSVTPTFVHKAHVPTFTGLEMAAIQVEAKRMFGVNFELIFELEQVPEHAHVRLEVTNADD